MKMCFRFLNRKNDLWSRLKRLIKNKLG